MSKLHIFDMDGTLLRGSACLDISRYMGQIAQVNEIEARWAVGQVGHVEFYELCLPLWKGLADSDVDAVFAGSDWLDGIPEVWSDIARRGEHSAVITLSPQFFAERLLAWGLGSAHGAEVQADTPPDPALVLTPDAKVAIADALMDRYELGPEDCVAYGDSSSDLLLFAHLPHSVAVNGSETLCRSAAASYVGSDLRDAYAEGRRLLTAASEGIRS